MSDFRLALRSLLKNPGFSAVVIVTLLFGIAGSDPLTYVGVIGTLVAAGVAACYLPARRAAGVNPMAALRME